MRLCPSPADLLFLIVVYVHAAEWRSVGGYGAWTSDDSSILVDLVAVHTTCSVQLSAPLTMVTTWKFSSPLSSSSQSSSDKAERETSHAAMSRVCRVRDGKRCVFTDELYEPKEETAGRSSAASPRRTSAASISSTPSPVSTSPTATSPLRNDNSAEFHVAHILPAAPSKRLMDKAFVEDLKKQWPTVYEEYKDYLEETDKSLHSSHTTSDLLL